MVHQNKNIKTKNTKNNLLPYSTPNVSNIHIIPKSWLLWSLHTNNVWEDRTLGSPQNSAVPMSPMFGRKSEDHTNTYLYHKQFTNNLLYFTTSLTIYFTLLHSLKTRLFINPVLNNPNVQCDYTSWLRFAVWCLRYSTSKLRPPISGPWPCDGWPCHSFHQHKSRHWDT